MLTNSDIKCECILGWFWNEDYNWRRFGMLTAIKSKVICPDGYIYEQDYGMRYHDFKPATIEEVKLRIHNI